RVAEIDKLMVNPQAFADRVASSVSGLEGDAPQTATALAAKAAKAAQFLQSKAPRNDMGPTLQPHLQEDRWKPTPHQASKFSRYWAAAMQPMSVLQDIEAGVLSPEAVETIRVLYPEMLDLIVAEVQRQAVESGTMIPFQTQ